MAPYSPTTFLVCVSAGRAPGPSTARPPASAAELRRAAADMVRGSSATHHSLAGWPAWEGWAEAWAVASTARRPGGYVGGLAVVGHPSGELHGPGRRCESSGCAGLADFPVSDELYCCPVFEADVVPLLRTDASMDGELFVSTYEHVVMGAERAPNCHDHPPASDLIAWATVAERSPVVYVQPGDSAATFGLGAYRLLLANALSWVASSDAHQWANSHEKPLENVDDEDP